LIYSILRRFQNHSEITKEERVTLIDNKLIKFSEDSNKVNFEWVKMSYKLTKKWQDLIDEIEIIIL
jgi:hypothetical protein